MRSFESRFSFRAATLLLVVAFAATVRSQPSNPPSTAPRVTLLKGNVTLQHPDGSSLAAAVGQMLSPGDQLSTAPASRVEIQFDKRVFQLGVNSALHMVAAQPDAYHFAIDKGSVSMQVLDTPAALADVRTPSVGTRPDLAGVYRIKVTPDGESRIIAEQGSIEVYAPAGSEWVPEGHKMIARGTADNPEFKVVDAVSKWRRVLRVALTSVQIAGDISSAFGGDSSGHAFVHKPAATGSSGNAATARAPSAKAPSAPRPAAPSHTQSPAPPKAK